MSSNKLKLNAGKTKAMLLGRKQQLSSVSVSNLHVGDTDIDFAKQVCNLGAELDAQMNKQAHVSAHSRSFFSHLRSISQIRKYLTSGATQALGHALVTSHMNYCNALLSGVPKVILNLIF